MPDCLKSELFSVCKSRSPSCSPPLSVRCRDDQAVLSRPFDIRVLSVYLFIYSHCYHYLEEFL